MKRQSAPTMSPHRAALYVRVSSEEQVQGYSLAAQERAGRDHCESHDLEIVEVYRDEGHSARTDNLEKRPGFKTMLEDAEAHQFDVVVVHKNDRFCRNRRVAFEAFHRLSSAGVGFVSIAENMDYSTPAGQLMLTMLVGLNQFYSDNLSFETKKGKQERKRQGRYNGLLPFGMTKGPNDVPVFDTEPRYCHIPTKREVIPGHGLQLAFELAAQGHTDREIASKLNETGYLSSGNRGMNAFTKDSVRMILTNRFYLGELPDGEGGWLPGKHNAVVDAKLFAKAQNSRSRNFRKPLRVPGKRSPWSLSGIARCGACGGLIKSTGHRRLRCSNRDQKGTCQEPSMAIAALDAQLEEHLRRFVIPDEGQCELVAYWQERQEQTGNTKASRKRIEQRLTRLRDLYLDGDLAKEEYQRQRAALQAQLALLPTDETPTVSAGKRYADFLANVALAWQAATPEERNRLARELFDVVKIELKTAVAVKPRPELRPLFEYIVCQDTVQERKRRDSNPRSQP
jgi:site-specific DNA recombinase